MAADHGVAAEGVSAYPSEVTGQMLLNFAAGGAAINVIARRSDARVLVVDMWVMAPASESSVIHVRRVGPGTRGCVHGPARSRDQAVQALETGIGIAADLTDKGATLIGLGDMGIGNSTAASALTAAFTGAPVAEVTG